MNIRRLTAETIVIPALFCLLVLSTPNRAFAVHCELASVCQSFTRAEAVFIGKVIDVRKVPSRLIPNVIVDFEVETRYKGASRARESVQFQLDESFSISFIPGEKYFVFKEPPNRPNVVCNRTNTLSNSVAEIEYANRVFHQQPNFLVSGVITGLSKDQLFKTKVIVEGKNRHKVPINNDGSFAFTSTTESRLEVTVTLPMDKTIYMKDMEAIHPVSGKIVRYKVNLGPNECSFRVISVSSGSL